MSLEGPLKSIMFRRMLVFAASVIVAGLSISVFCLVPLIVPHTSASSIFPDALQENFFFDVFGLVGGCWLLCWVCSVCGWATVGRLGQWLGIIFLSLDQMVLIAQWQSLSHFENFWTSGLFLVPFLLEAYFLGLYFSFFTLPALTASGNKTLTGLGTLVVLLPLLVGREAIILGTRLLP